MCGRLFLSELIAGSSCVWTQEGFTPWIPEDAWQAAAALSCCVGEGEGSDPPPSPRQKPDLPLHAGRELLPVGVAAFPGCTFQQMLLQKTSHGKSLG